MGNQCKFYTPPLLLIPLPLTCKFYTPPLLLIPLPLNDGINLLLYLSLRKLSN